MGIYRFKYLMNLLMTLIQYFAVTTALGIGGWWPWSLASASSTTRGAIS